MFSVSRTVRPRRSRVCTTITSPSRAYSRTARSPGRSTVAPDFLVDVDPIAGDAGVDERFDLSVEVLLGGRDARVSELHDRERTGGRGRTTQAARLSGTNLWDAPGRMPSEAAAAARRRPDSNAPAAVVRCCKEVERCCMRPLPERRITEVAWPDPQRRVGGSYATRSRSPGPRQDPVC